MALTEPALVIVTRVTWLSEFATEIPMEAIQCPNEYPDLAPTDT
jgi:hypothetical protein